MNTKLIHFIVLSGLTLCALPSAAQIILVNTGSLNNINNQTSYTLSFDASNGGSPVNKLIVSAGTESGSAAQITGITYNGVALTLIPNSGGGSLNRTRGLWYLDNPFSGSAADIVVSGTATAFNHMRLGVASISGSAPGAASAKVNSAASVSLNVPVNDSFVFAAHASNLLASVTTADSPLTQIFSVTGDSANMAAGYQNSVAAGPATYSFTNTLDPQTAVAAFVPATAAPVLVGVSPADNATNAAIGANLVATFSEPVAAGTGDVELWQVGGGSPVESFNVASSPQLTLSGQTLTINPTANLTSGVEYHILIPANALVDTTGSTPFAGISDPTAWSFTADITPPSLVSVNPADNAPSVLVSSNLVATFNESVVAGTGNVELWQDGGGSPLESFDVTSSPLLTFSGATLTINPTANLTPGNGYHIRIAPTAIVDASNFAFAGISDPTVWNFTTDGTLPTLATLSPVDDAGLVSLSANLVATFSEAVAAGTGNIELWKAGGGSPVESFDVASSPQLTISGATLTINPTANLEYSAAYYVIIPSTAVKDLSGNLFSGLTASTAWNFTTGNAPPSLTFLNKATFNDNVTKTGTTGVPTTWTYTKDFDPDDTADALVLMLATEAATPSATVSFGSQTMTQVIMNGNNPVGIYYLNNPSTLSQTVSVTINLPGSGSINGMGFTILALNSSVNGGIVPTAVVNEFTSAAPLSIDINVPDTGSFVVAGSNNGADSSLALSLPLTSLHSGDFGSLRAVLGYEENVAAGSNTYTFTGATSYSAAVAFLGVAAPANSFSSWISNPAFGLAVADQDLGDDPDGDGIGNGVENFFGTNPGTFSQGLLVGIKSGNTFTFTHPKNATPASDLTASYTWSKDLASFLASGATDGAGTTVAFTTQADTPSPGITTVTATVTGTAASNLFVRVNVTQP